MQPLAFQRRIVYTQGVHNGGFMVRIGVKEARANLAKLIERVSSGEQVVLLSRGKEIARLVPPAHQPKKLPSLARFRMSVRIRGEAASAAVLKARKEARF